MTFETEQEAQRLQSDVSLLVAGGMHSLGSEFVRPHPHFQCIPIILSYLLSSGMALSSSDISSVSVEQGEQECSHFDGSLYFMFANTSAVARPCSGSTRVMHYVLSGIV